MDKMKIWKWGYQKRGKRKMEVKSDNGMMENLKKEKRCCQGAIRINFY